MNEKLDKKFRDARRKRIRSYPGSALAKTADAFLGESAAALYSYNFDWMGRPVIQLPQDMIAIQEIVMKTKPDLIIETGIALGGSLVFHASLLTLLDYSDAHESDVSLDPSQSKRKVLGVDIDIRKHNRAAILEHPMSQKITMLEGSSVDKQILDRVSDYAQNHERVMVCLDSNHTHEHVLEELTVYAPLVSEGCYCIVFDTLIEYMPDDMYPDRPWGPGANPATAVKEYLDKLKKEKHVAADGEILAFRVDADIDNKLLYTMNKGGYLLRCAP